MSHEGLSTERLKTMKCAKCKGDSDCNDIVLAARCHPKAGVDASSYETLLAVRCHECHRIVVELMAPQKLDMSKVPLHEHKMTCDCGGEICIIELTCHPHGPIDLLYQKSSHALAVRCTTCEAVAGTIPLSAIH
jgi:hypothetical protein